MIFKPLIVIQLIVVSLMLSSCNSGGGGSSSTEEGITVTLAATHQQTPDATLQIPVVPAGTRTFQNSEGLPITLTKAYLVIWSAKLESDCTTTLFTQFWPSVFNWLVPTATAHTETTPNQLGVPNVIDLLAADLTEIELGTIQPSPGDYCGLTVELLKADDDTQRLPTDINMVNRMLYLEGEYISFGSDQPIAFKVDIAKAPLPRHLALFNPLTLSSEHRTARLVVSIHYDRWFDGLDLSALETETQQDLLLQNLVSSLHEKTN
ncbi:secreted protein [Beggiatoa sp. PS]|nr:secreted protein [Beggiatoa sp. PS]